MEERPKGPRWVITEIGRALYRADPCPLTKKQHDVLFLLNLAVVYGSSTGCSVEELAADIGEPVAAVERIVNDLVAMRALWPVLPT